MKRILSLLIIWISGMYAQCVVTDSLEYLNFNNSDFVGTGGTWTVVQGQVTNTWIANADYDYGIIPPYSTLPNQPSGITGSPNSAYAHIACYGNSCSTLNLQNDPSYLDDGSNATEQIFLESPVYSVAGSDSVKFSFYGLINGVTNNDYGYIEVKLDNGSWQMLGNTLNGITNWTQYVHIINTTNVSSLQLRFVFRITHDGNGQDPSFCIDEVKIIKYETLVLDTSVTYNSTTKTLTANATGVSYQWVDCSNNYSPVAGATSASFTPMTTGSFAVIVSSGSCVDTSGCHYVDLTTSLQSQLVKSVNYYPSVVKDYLYLKGSYKQGKLINLLGKEVLSFGRNTSQLDLRNLSKGIYFLETDNKIIGKIIKE